LFGDGISKEDEGESWPGGLALVASNIILGRVGREGAGDIKEDGSEEGEEDKGDQGAKRPQRAREMRDVH
jgi:hypothetical protein